MKTNKQIPDLLTNDVNISQSSFVGELVGYLRLEKSNSSSLRRSEDHGTDPTADKTGLGKRIRQVLRIYICVDLVI